MTVIGGRFCVSLQTSVYVHLIVSESNNGESLSQARRLMPKRHNAKRCAFPIRQQIVNALANGDSKRAIARALRVSNNTVTAVAEQEWQQVEARKARIAAQAEQIASRSADLMLERLNGKDAHKLPLNVLVPTFGVAVDKTLSLRGDSLATVHHLHSVDLTDDDLIAFAVARSHKRSEKRAQAAVVEVPALPPETRLQAKKTPRKKPAELEARKRLNKTSPFIAR